MQKIFSIGEISKEIGVNTHVIRNWCEKFSNLQITKGTGGRRYFDEKLLIEFKKIKTLIEKYGMSIEGVKKLIKHDKIKSDALVRDLSFNTEENFVEKKEDTDEKFDAQRALLREALLFNNLKQEFINDLDFLKEGF